MADREYFHSSDRPVDFQPPPLDAMMAFRGVYALCTLNKEGRLKATHYTCVLLGGPQPIWGIWTIHGTFVRFAARRSAVAAAYPNLVWRHKQATWSLVAIHDMSEEDRRAQLHRLYGRGKHLTGRERDTVLRDLDMLVPKDKPDDPTNVVRLAQA